MAMPDSPWKRLRSAPRWPVPAYYNVAEDACDKHPPDKLAMIWDDDRGDIRHIRWGELQDRSARMANALVGAGVGIGDRVAVIVRQSPEAACAMLAVLRCGAVLVTISELLADATIQHRIDDVDARLIITEARLLDRFATAGPQVLALDRWDLTRASDAFRTVRMPADAPAFIAYTSGTTGRAKGVVQPHRVMLAGEELSFVQDLRDGEVFYGIGDWSWWVRKILGPWQYGAVSLSYRYDRYDPEKLLATLARHRVTNAFINATAIRMMSQDRMIGRKYPQQLRIASSSNEPLGLELATWFQDQFHVYPFEFYGCTEVGIMIGGSPYCAVKPGAMGVTLPGCEVRILGEDGREAAPGQQGEICLLARSNPNYPLGYWRRPEDTERDFGGQWFRTKDMAHRDEDGYFWYVGRNDDVIKASGYRIGPHEVEDVLREHPAIADAAVVGSKNPERGVSVVAMVVLRAEAEAGEVLKAELQRLVREKYAAYAAPKEIRFVAELPRSSTEKSTGRP